MIVFLRTWALGLKSLMLHPMRSLLTILGIFIGVASVIWLLAIGEGISREAQKQIEGLGAENILVRSVKPPSEATANVRGAVPYGLTRDEFDTLVQTIPTLKSAIPIREMRRQFVTKLKEKVPGSDYSFVMKQRGMFSYSGLTKAQVDTLREKYSIYAIDTGRICVAALNSKNIDYVVDSVAKVIS